MTAMNRFVDRLREGNLLFDGAVGSMLIAAGLESGSCPEEWNLSRSEVLRDVHKSYLEAGARVITTNSFGATPSRLKKYGLADSVVELNNAAVRLARDAIAVFEASKSRANGVTENPASPVSRETPPFVAFSIGPTGNMLPPVGQTKEAEIEADYAAQLQAVAESYDCVLIETVFDLREGIIACKTAKRLAKAPVGVSIAFDRKPTGFFTVMGDRVTESLERLEAAGADFVGANCSITSKDMLELVDTLRNSTALPVVCQPNAGQPVIKDRTAVYEQSPEDFAADVVRFFDSGINAVGGCCGTTPDYIRAVYARMRP